MHKGLHHWLVATVLGMGVGAAVLAQAQGEAPSIDADGAATWRLQFEPMAWAPALNGNLDLTGGDLFDIDVISMSEVAWAPAWQVSLREDKWTITLDGFDFETSGDGKASEAIAGSGVSVVAGDTVDYDVSYAAYTLTLSRRVWTMPVANQVAGVDLGVPDGPADVPSDGVGVFVDVLGGARLYDLGLQLDSGGSVLADEDHTWVDAIVGARLSVDFPLGIGLDVTGDVGTLGSVFAWNIEVGVHYAISDNVAAEIGFRHLDTLYEDSGGGDPFEWDVALAGLYGSIVIRF